MRIPLLVTLLFLSTGASAQLSVADTDIALHAPDAAWRVYGKAQAWAAYDTIPIGELTGDWDRNYTPRDGRNVFLQRNRIETGVEKDGWHIGVEYRAEASLRASRDTVELYRMYRSKQRPAQARVFDVDLRLKGWAAGGLRVGRTVALAAGADAPLLMVSAAVYGRARNLEHAAAGKVGYAPDGAYRLDASYAASRNNYDYLFRREAEQASAGATTSVAAQWPLTKELTVNVAVNDLWSRLRWRNLPSTTATVASDVREVDSDGYINYKPQIAGRNSLITRIDRIGASTALNLSYRLESWLLRAGAERIAGTTIPLLTAAYSTRWGSFSGSYDTRFNTFGAGYDYGPLRLRLRADRLPVTDASVFALELGAQHVF
jgi:hypothetical protein